MNIRELRERLRREGFRSDVDSLDEGLPAYEGLLLRERLGQWTIEHYERGEYRQLAALNSEVDACDRMYELLIKYFG